MGLSRKKSFSPNESPELPVVVAALQQQSSPPAVVDSQHQPHPLQNHHPLHRHHYNHHHHRSPVVVAVSKDLMAKEAVAGRLHASLSPPQLQQQAQQPSAISQSSSSFRFFKYFVFSYMLLVLVVEIAWAAYSTQGLKKDLQMYVESGEWEQTYVREFFKSTKNFFMFNLILIFLSICIGCAAVGTENRHLILAFLFIFSIEWFFEVIGVYNSKEKNVVIYRMIPALLRPGLIVSTLIFYRTLSKIQSLMADEIEKEEANKPPSPPPVVRVINPLRSAAAARQPLINGTNGILGVHATSSMMEPDVVSNGTTGNNNETHATAINTETAAETTTSAVDPVNPDSVKDSGIDRNVLRISVE